MASATPLSNVSGFFAVFRGLFMPVGLFAIIALGVHAAADVVDDRLLVFVEHLDAWLDALFAQTAALASWVNKIDSRERTVIARALALAWELAVDALIALPAIGYGEEKKREVFFSGAQTETWKSVFARVNRAPTTMRILRPVISGIFAIGGAYAVSRLVESTLFVGLQGDLATAETASILARIAGGLAMAMVVFSLGWRAALRALQHADNTCFEIEKAGRSAWFIGLWGTALSFPLAVALVLEARSLLSFVL